MDYLFGNRSAEEKPRTRLALIIAAAAMALWFPLSAGAAMKMTPYLQAVTMDSVYVMVECDSQNPVTVDYGTTAAYGKTAATENTAATTANPPTCVHRIKLSGLRPNTLYHYRASQDGTPGADFTFRTAVKPGTGFRFAWMADMRTGTAVHETTAARVKAANPRFSLYGGDLCANDSYGLFKREFFLPGELNLIARVPFFNSPGNHEGWSPNTKAFTKAPASPSGTEDYYSFDYGDLHVVCINNMVPDDLKSAQCEFVRDDLAKSTKPWKIVFCHVPVYCAGGHNDNKKLIEVCENVFVPNKVDLVLVGHSHFYQHNLVNGIHHLVIGSAGAPLYDPGNAAYVVKSARSYNYAIIDVTSVSLHLVVYDEKGGVLDTLHLGKPIASRRTGSS